MYHSGQESINLNLPNIISTVEEICCQLRTIICNGIEDQLIELKECSEELINSSAYHDIFDSYETFCSSLTSPLTRFWSSYISMVQLLMHFIRSIRGGNWLLHLACIRDMLPWMFGYDHTNYNRYLSVYWTQMQVLPKEYPNAYKRLLNGDFTVQRNFDAGYAQVAVDQTIE